MTGVTEGITSWFIRLDGRYIGILFGAMFLSTFIGLSNRPWARAIGGLAAIYGVWHLLTPPTDPSDPHSAIFRMIILVLGVYAGAFMRMLYHRRTQIVVRFVR
jgi:hypothetical protein